MHSVSAVFWKMFNLFGLGTARFLKWLLTRVTYSETWCIIFSPTVLVYTLASEHNRSSCCVYISVECNLSLSDPIQIEKAQSCNFFCKNDKRTLRLYRQDMALPIFCYRKITKTLLRRKRVLRPWRMEMIDLQKILILCSVFKQM